MEPSTFGLRLGYLRWLRHLATSEAPTHNEIGRAVNRNGVTVAEWMERTEFPDVRALDEALSRYFGASAKWIADGEGEPPLPTLWKIWLRVQRVRMAPKGGDALKAVEDELRKRG